MLLEWLDYSEGPITDELNKHGEMWVFGKDVKGTEVYIKISMGVLILIRYVYRFMSPSIQ